MGSDNSIRRVLNVLPPGTLHSAAGPHSYEQPEFFLLGNNSINFNVSLSFKMTIFDAAFRFSCLAPSY